MILIAGTTADTNRPYHLAIPLQRNAASKNHDLPLFKHDAEDSPPDWDALPILRFNVKGAGGVGFS